MNMSRRARIMHATVGSTLAERIKAARLSCGLSQHDLAARIGVSDSLVAHWEANRRMPSINAALAIAVATGAHALDLLLGEYPAHNTPQDEILLLRAYRALDTVRRGEVLRSVYEIVSSPVSSLA